MIRQLFSHSLLFYTLLLEGVESVAAAAKSLQSCPTLCDPIDSSPPGSAIPGILQARTLEWVAISQTAHESRLSLQCFHAASCLVVLTILCCFKLTWNSALKRLRSWYPVPSLHGKQMGKKWKQWQILFSWAPKSLRRVTTAMKLKDTCSLERKLWQT